ncbi:MAG: hypothetical protein ACJ786_22570 [Catenulispora sp.]
MAKPDRDAEFTEFEASSPDWRTLLIKVAESVTVEEAPVALPIHVEGPPKGVALNTARLDETMGGPSSFEATLVYGPGTADRSAAASFTISIWPAAEEAGPAENTPASACKDDKALRICVLDKPADGVDTLASVGGVEGLLARITSLGTDRADWTTQVVN